MMTQAVFYCSFKLRKDADVSEFLKAAQALNDGYISKQPGYVSWQQLRDGDTWADFLVFDSMENVKHFEDNAENAGELAMAFHSFLNHNSCKQHYFTIERNYQ